MELVNDVGDRITDKKPISEFVENMLNENEQIKRDIKQVVEERNALIKFFADLQNFIKAINNIEEDDIYEQLNHKLYSEIKNLLDAKASYAFNPFEQEKQEDLTE